MSRDWTQEELQAASVAMKAAGHMSYEEFCEELHRQEELSMTNLSRDDFNHALDDFLCEHPETEEMDIISVQRDDSWYAVGELDGECYLLAENEDGISMDKMED
ncbi:MAG: hypothetical protein LUD12_01710 [Lachnospiraceae bacterium]|nr:hypothetical protein [Lachnospiraceae bacterium]